MSSGDRGEAGQLSRWSDKDDAWLVEVLRGDDPQDVDTAMRVLQTRYRTKLQGFVRRKLPEAWVDDTVQEIWLRFYRQARVQRIENVAAYLRGIASRIRARNVKKLTRERQIEVDIAPAKDDEEDDGWDWQASETIEETLAGAEARVIKEHQLDLLKQLPFLGMELSDCQRVLWILRQIYAYPSRAVGRLLGKSPSNIDVQTYKARIAVKEYFQSDRFEIALANDELPSIWEPQPRREGAVVVERFAEAVSPRFTPDELKPLGISLEEFQREYVASLMLPRWHEGQELRIGGFSMLLARRTRWADAQELYRRLAQGEENVEPLIQEECLLDVTIEDGQIHLSIQPIVEVVPEGSQEQISTDNTYLSVHSPRLVVPVILGFFDRSLYTPDLLARWPFVTPDTGL